MPRRYVNQLAERDSVDQVFLVADKQLRANRQGNFYLQLRLADKTGSITGMLWNANEKLYGSLENQNYLRVQGSTQVHNGILQMIVTRVEPVQSSEVEESDFQTVSSVETDRLAARLAEMLRGVKNVHLRDLAECFLVDEAFMAKFTAAPAGMKNHHAYKGGLLEHVVSLMEVCLVVAPRYKEIDGDLLLLGAFLHDAGKIDELTYDKDLGYSDEGQLIGHVVMGVSMVADKARQAASLSGEEFPRELLLRLEHMVVSHHGEYEFGSPKLPMTLEAIALHYLDNLDAKLYSAVQVMKEDVNSESSWTSYNQAMGRKFFRGAEKRSEGRG
jgi:3'-5' exoribonuclease